MSKDLGKPLWYARTYASATNLFLPPVVIFSQPLHIPSAILAGASPKLEDITFLVIMPVEDYGSLSTP